MDCTHMYTHITYILYSHTYLYSLVKTSFKLQEVLNTAALHNPYTSPPKTMCGISSKETVGNMRNA